MRGRSRGIRKNRNRNKQHTINIVGRAKPALIILLGACWLAGWLAKFRDLALARASEDAARAVWLWLAGAEMWSVEPSEVQLDWLPAGTVVIATM